MREPHLHPGALGETKPHIELRQSKFSEVTSWSLVTFVTILLLLASAEVEPVQSLVIRLLAAASLAMLLVILRRLITKNKRAALILALASVTGLGGLAYEAYGEITRPDNVKKEDFEVASLTLAILVCPILNIILANAFLRRLHAKHVYILFYTFSLMTSLGFGVYFYLDHLDLISVGLLGNIDIREAVTGNTLASFLQWYFKVSQDARGEIVLTAVIVTAVVLPQITSLVISGFFGCGMPPMMVSKVSKFAIVSIIKFLCVFSGLTMAQELYRFYGRPGERGILINGVDIEVGMSLCFLAAAFGLSALYYGLQIALSQISIEGDFAAFGKLWAHMTRFTRERKDERSETSILTASIALASASFDVIVALRQFRRELVSIHGILAGNKHGARSSVDLAPERSNVGDSISS